MDDLEEIEKDIRYLEKHLLTFRSNDETRDENLLNWKFEQLRTALRRQHEQQLNSIEKYVFLSQLPDELMLAGLVLLPILMALYGVIKKDFVFIYISLACAMVSLILVAVGFGIKLILRMREHRVRESMYSASIMLRDALRRRLMTIYGIENPETFLGCPQCEKGRLQFNQIEADRIIYYCPKCKNIISFAKMDELLQALGIDDGDEN